MKAPSRRRIYAEIKRLEASKQRRDHDYVAGHIMGAVMALHWTLDGEMIPPLEMTDAIRKMSILRKPVTR